MPSIRSLSTALTLLIVLVTMGCGEVTAPVAPSVSTFAPFANVADGKVVSSEIACAFDLKRGTSSCNAAEESTLNQGALTSLLITNDSTPGASKIYFGVTASALTCNNGSTPVCTQAVTITNRMTQPVGVDNFGQTSNIQVIIKAITATKQNGQATTVTVGGDGNAVFTGLTCTNQGVAQSTCPYFNFPGNLGPNATSISKTFTHTTTAPSNILYFTLTIFAKVPEENALLRWVTDQQQITSVGGLYGIHGTANTNVFTVGDTGRIQRYNGTAWTTQASGTSLRLNSVWAASSTDAIAVGFGGTVLRYNGTTWAPMASTPASAGVLTTWYGTFGFSPSQIFVVGTFGAIRYWNGTSWTSMTSPTTQHLTSVWGTSSTNAYATGVNGTLLRWNGTTWSTISLGLPATSANNLYNVWGGSATDVWAAGRNGLLFHSTDGTTFTQVSLASLGLTSTYLWGMWGTGPSDVYLSTGNGNVVHWDGTKWWSHSTGQSSHLFGMWGTSITNMFGVGANRTIARGIN
jgi:hypothetical protein